MPSGWLAVFGIPWCVEASPHLCFHLHVALSLCHLSCRTFPFSKDTSRIGLKAHPTLGKFILTTAWWPYFQIRSYSEVRTLIRTLGRIQCKPEILLIHTDALYELNIPFCFKQLRFEDCCISIVSLVLLNDRSLNCMHTVRNQLAREGGGGAWNLQQHLSERWVPCGLVPDWLPKLGHASDHAFRPCQNLGHHASLLTFWGAPWNKVRKKRKMLFSWDQRADNSFISTMEP